MTRAEMISLIQDRIERADLRELEMICGLILVAGATTHAPSIPPTMAVPHKETDSSVPVNTLTLSVREAAKYMGVSASTMYEIVKSKGFPAIHIGTRILVSAKGLEEWVAEQAKMGW